MMPHPERCSEQMLGNEDGRIIFQSMIESLKKAGQAKMVGAG
jgi:phosphoribosylformylglycinamidine synthase